MINWKHGHSGVIAAVSLAASILLYYLALVIPVEVPLILFMILFFIPPILLTAIIDHGHANTQWSIRWRRLALSWVVVFAWLVAGSSVPATMSGNLSLSTMTSGQLWGYIWPLLILAAVIAWIGIAVVRWIERGNNALMVIDQPKKKA